MIGKTISHYKILEKLGEGGMGVVYKAEDTELQRNVALKFLTPQALGSEEENARFVHEARSAAALDHPNICTVYEINKVEDQTFIAMAYIEGQSLRDRIEAGPLKIDEVVRLTTQIAEGLAKAHEKGVIHRDIKPANIMVTSEGQAKIMDFGLAKSAKRTVVTQAGTTVGTVAYMSPEQAQGEDVDCRTDVWSLGALLYEMVAGQRAFKGDYEPAVVYSILNEVQEPLTALRTGVPTELERIVDKCLAKDKGERYQTARDLVADLLHLKRILAESGTRSRPAVFSKVSRRPIRAWLWGLAVVATVVVAVAILRLYFAPSEKEPDKQPAQQQAQGLVSERKMLVVLPFDNLGAPEDEYFASGMTEEITSRLAAIHDFGVISRTTAFQYKDTDKTLKQIGEELGVDYVLEGTVRWERVGEGSSRVRVTPQLVRVYDDTHLWSERYDRDLEEIFAVQSQIAEQVIQKLGATLLDSERHALEARPTDNLEAYSAYLRGLDYAKKRAMDQDYYRLAQQMFERAVELDPDFALAHAELSQINSHLYFTGFDPSQDRLSLALKAAERALELEPELPEGHMALGYYYYWGMREYAHALEEFAIAEESIPNDSRIETASGFIRRRQGEFEKALAHFKNALELSPRDAHLAFEVGITCVQMRKYEEAESYLDRSISLNPDQNLAYYAKAWGYWCWRGDIHKARNTLENMPYKDQIFPMSLWIKQELLERDCHAALRRLSSSSIDHVDASSGFTPKPLMAAEIHRLMGELEISLALYDSARVEIERGLEESPDNPHVHALLGVAYAGLGRKEDAIREGKLAMEILPVSKDAFSGTDFVENLVHIYVLVGEFDEAIDQLEYLLSIPCPVSVPRLRIDPSYDPLRGHPRFQRLVGQYSVPGS